MPSLPQPIEPSLNIAHTGNGRQPLAIADMLSVRKGLICRGTLTSGGGGTNRRVTIRTRRSGHDSLSVGPNRGFFYLQSIMEIRAGL